MVSFGDSLAARVATLSMNPSSSEFVSKDGDWLLGPKRRLASFISLGVSDPRELDDEAVHAVLTESNQYFQGLNWFRKWFGRLEALLNASGFGSYIDGSACHLDLVQWATHPIQRDVPAPAWDRLVQGGREFLAWQLAQANLDTVLVNGMACVRELLSAKVVQAWSEEQIAYATRSGPATLRLFKTEELGVRFIGWNRPVAGQLPADGLHQLRDWLVSTGSPVRKVQRDITPRNPA